MAMRLLAVGALLCPLALAGQPAKPQFVFEPQKHSCGVCREVRGGVPCELFGSCHVINGSSVQDGCRALCPAGRPPREAAERTLELRVAKGFGTKPYDMLRVSVIDAEPSPPLRGRFDYSSAFKYRWTHMHLHSTMISVTPGVDTQIDLGSATATIRLPAQGAGVAGVLIADPCVPTPDGWIACEFGEKFQTSERTIEMINTFVPSGEIDFWGIFGDNFYDRLGNITQSVFQRISLEAKSKIFMTVPGNHDYWVLGSPNVSTNEDQCANGHMQFYAQDAKSAENVAKSNSSSPFDFSVDPHRLIGCNLPKPSNAFWYNQIGNVGFVGQSGAYSLEEVRPFMSEACAWLSKQPGLRMAVLLGHWDVGEQGASSEMAMPQWYTEMAALPGCSELDQKSMLKFVMGHTHCNDPHPHGRYGAGFRVAGFGMEGCGNYGVPIVDTTDDRVRFWYFDASSDDKYHELISCVTSSGGWRSCTHLATLWLDQPLAPASGEQSLLLA